MHYTVLKIEEDLEFGCEEHADDAPVMAVVTLADSAGHTQRLRLPDQLLYQRDINEGDRVAFDDAMQLQKISG